MDRILVFDICSLLIQIVLFISVIFHKMTRGKIGGTYNFLIILTILSTITDLVRVCITRYAPHNQNSVIWFTHICYLYLFFRNETIPAFIMFLFALTGWWHKYRNSSFLKISWEAIAGFIGMIIFVDMFAHQLFTITPDLEFVRGKWMILLYVWSAISMIYALGCIFSSKRLLKTNQFILLLILILITIAGVVVELFFPRYSIEIFCTTVPLMFIFLLIQKPAENIDSSTSCLSYHAFMDELKLHEKLQDNARIVLFQIENEKELEQQYSSDTITALISYIASSLFRLTKNKETDVYHLNSYSFGIISTQNSQKYIESITKNIENFLTEPKLVGKINIQVNFKVCVIDFPSDFNNLDSVLSFLNLMNSCISKVNKISYFSEEKQQSDFEIKLSLNEIISRAIQNNNFQMYYQPIYSLKEKKFISAEALIRLKDDKFGFVSPAVFIPAAEQTGAIHQIGDFVVKDVCRFIKENDFERLGLKYIELNLSVAQLIEINLVSKINKYLYDTGVKKTQVNLEVTETAEDLDPEIFMKNVNHLSEEGYSFSLDDFGTGYSNVERVVTLPVEIIKMDKSFADEYANDEMAIIIQNDINMIHQLNKKALVEGIESKVQMEQFEKWGIDFIQGYYYSKPLSEKDFIQFLKMKNNSKVEVDDNE